jgi:hypothetical protein
MGQLSGTCEKPFEAAAQPGRRIGIYVRSGDVTISGTSGSAVRVRCMLGDGSAPKGVRISFAAGNLRIYSGPNRKIRLQIDVPERSDLLVRSLAGNVSLAGVTGDKDVSLRAGDLTIQVGSPEVYRVAEGSVLAGSLNAPAFGVVKDGLFRSFRKSSENGQYRLRADLTAGDLTLK